MVECVITPLTKMNTQVEDSSLKEVCQYKTISLVDGFQPQASSLQIQ